MRTHTHTYTPLRSMSFTHVPLAMINSLSLSIHITRPCKVQDFYTLVSTARELRATPSTWNLTSLTWSKMCGFPGTSLSELAPL